GFQAGDDIAVAAAALEYATDPAKPQSQPIDLAKVGPTTYDARATLKLPPEQLQAGTKFRYRVRVEDNKPKDLGGPNVSYFPPGHWIEVDVVAGGEDKGAEILAQRDGINLKLNQLIDDVARQWRAANKV